MAEALVSFLIEQLGSIVIQQVGQNVKLVVNAKREVANLKLNLESIQAVLADAERRQVKESSVRRWLSSLKEVSFEIDDVVGEWSYEILKQQIEKQGENAVVPKKKVCFSIPFLCPCYGQVNQIIIRLDIAGKIKELNEKLDSIHNQRKFYNFQHNETRIEQPLRLKSFSIVDKSGTFGRDYEKKTLVSQLVSEHSEEMKQPLVISIVGLGGIGKTTLAQLAFNDDEVKNCFRTRIWVCVSEPFVQIAVAKAILEGLKVNDVPNSNELETYVQLIAESIQDKRFLLVLDDVWDSDHRKWEPFLTTLQCGPPGSRILVTTRIAQVARAMGATSGHTIHLHELSEETCRSLFYHIAFFDGERKESQKFRDIGDKIVKRCKGLPLAARTMGSLLRCKETLEQWVDVLNSKLWELKEVEQQVFQPLLLSYYDLEPISKRCLLYCATFPKDHVIYKDELIELWMSQDYLEVKGGSTGNRVVGERCFEYLVTRSFFQDFKEYEGKIESCKMHDIVHDFVQYLTRDECFSMVVNDANERMELPGDEVRHLSLMFAPEGPFPVSVLNCQSLRTLTAFESKLTSIGVELISQSKSLRTLNLSGRWKNKVPITEVPKEIGGLIHLRYLNLSHNEQLKELPDSLCDLYNLQTLRLEWCSQLVKLPGEEGMRKLTKLKHLYVRGSCRLKSKGIGRLTGLQNLDVFHINGYEGADKEGTLRLEDLKDLHQLEGILYVTNLGSVEDASEAVEACLREKRLSQQILDFNCYDCRRDCREEGAGQKDEEIVNGLQPHQDLESLNIHNCRATHMCPNWILSLHKLTTLILMEFPKCELLSGPLGRLPSLESLRIQEMEKVRKVGVQFLGVDDGELQSSSSSGLTLFPKLKSLKFLEMGEWEEWEGVGRDIQNDNIQIMPSLSHLKLKSCRKLGTLPDFLRSTPLHMVAISYSEILGDIVQDKASAESAKISHAQNIKIDDEFVKKDGSLDATLS